MKWSIQELAHRIRRLGATGTQRQPQKNIKVVSRREAFSQAGRPGEDTPTRQSGSTPALPAGVEDVFCATAATAPAIYVGPESSSNSRPPLRRSRTLGNGSVSRRGAAACGDGNASRGGHRATAGCETGGTTETSGQPSSRPPLRRATSDTDAAANGAAHNAVRTKQRRELAEPPAGNKPSALPVIRRTASSTDNLRHGSGTRKPGPQPPSAATRAAVDTAWPAVSVQDAGGTKSGRPTMRRRNSLPVMPHPPEASAAISTRSGARDRQQRETQNRPPAVRGNDRVFRGDTNGVGVRPMPRPKSLNLGVRTSSFSSIHYYEALQAQEEIDREEARRGSRRREDRGGGIGTSAVRERSKQPRQRRTFHRSRSAHQIERTTRGEKGQVRRNDNPSSPAEAPSELRRSSSLGSTFWPVSPRSHDVCGKDYLQQHRHKTRERSERGLPGTEASSTTEDRENEEHVDIRAISAGCGGVGDGSPSVGKKNPTPFSPRSRNRSRSQSRSRSRSRPRSIQWEVDREKIKQRAVVAPPAEAEADGAAASARSAAAGATAAAVRAAAAADEATELAKARVASAPGGRAAAAAAAVVAVGSRRRGAKGPAADETSPPAPSSVWVTRFLDLSSTYGLAFLLSDGSVGVLFKDSTKMVVDHAGENFDYVEPPGSWTMTTAAAAAATAPPSRTSPIHEAESGAGGRPQNAPPPDGGTPDNNYSHHHRYRLDSFPFFLRNKVRVLRYVREGLCLDRGGEVEGCGSTAAADGQNRREPLTFIEKWQRAGGTHCFQLSHQVVQVIFSDGTEVLLSKDRQMITFVSEDGTREIQPRPKMEHRAEVMKRIRCAEDFMFLMLESP